jgi:hypothetical protein
MAERRMRKFENGMLGGILRLKREEVGENILLLLLLLLDNKIKEQEMGRTCKMHEKTEKCIQIMVRKCKRERPLPRSGHR